MDTDNLPKIKTEIYQSLTRGYRWLFNKAIHSGNWTEVRSTALAGLCLCLREPQDSIWLQNVKKWLLEQQIEMGDTTASWGEELWDTSMALLSLKRMGLSPTEPKIQNALKWIDSLYNLNGRHNWHDEPWETGWSILAILENEPNAELLSKAYDASKWFLSLQDQKGKVISAHYTAYLLLIGDRLSARQKDSHIFNNAMNNAANYLIEANSQENLWTGEAWSNGQILWALASTKRFPYDNNDILSRVVNWFASNQEIEGNWSDVEDTASSILGLSSLLVELESVDTPNQTQVDTLIYNALRRSLETPTLCIKHRFIEKHEDGYTSINLSPRFKRWAALVLAIASAATVVISLWDFFKEIFKNLFNTT